MKSNTYILSAFLAFKVPNIISRTCKFLTKSNISAPLHKYVYPSVVSRYTQKALPFPLAMWAGERSLQFSNIWLSLPC